MNECDLSKIQPIPKAIAECLRFEALSPVNGRWVTADAEFQGHVVPKGSTLLLLNGSGNRDDATFLILILILIDSTSGAMSIVTYRSAMGRTSALAPRSLASKVRWLCGRCSSGSQQRHHSRAVCE
jgi:hypothetical protein